MIRLGASAASSAAAATTTATAGVTRAALRASATVTPAAVGAVAASGAASSLRGVATAAVGAVAVVGALAATSGEEVAASGAVVHPAEYPWSHSAWNASFDHAAIRRGHQVFTQVCKSCHSLDRIAYRNLVGVAYTEDEAKEIAAQETFDDEPDDKGKIGKRKGKLSDYFWRPYQNEQEARAKNSGALPPDLSLIVKARHGNENYVFALLTGYKDAPAGVNIRDGLHYNPYFPGGAIGMAQALYDGAVVYDDGTDATASQMAKDVAVFLAWAAEPESDDRKRMGIKAIFILTLCCGAAFYLKRMKWAPVKTRRIIV